MGTSRQTMVVGTTYNESTTCSGTAEASRYTETIQVKFNSLDETNMMANVTIKNILKSRYVSWAQDSCAFSLSAKGTQISAETGEEEEIVYFENITSASSGGNANSSAYNKTYVEWTGDIPYNDDGTLTVTFTAKVSGGDTTYTPGSGTAVIVATFPTITVAVEILSIEGNELGTDVVVTIDKKEESYTYKMDYSFAGSDWKVASENVDSVCNIPTPLEDFATRIPNNASGVLTVRVVPYNGTVQIGAGATKTVVLHLPDNVVPTIENLVVSPVSDTVPIDWGMYLKDNSKALLEIMNPTGVYDSTITSFFITSEEFNGTEQTLTTGFFTTVGTKIFTATVTDSRGRTSEPKEITIEVVDYFKPSIAVNADRCLEDGEEDISGTYLTVDCNYAYASVNGKNTFTKEIECNGIKVTDFENNVEFIMNANCDPTLEYILFATITDALGYSTTVTKVISRESLLLTITLERDGMGFGCYPEEGKAKFGFPAEFMKDVIGPVGSIAITSTNQPPSIGYWELIDKELAPKHYEEVPFTANSTNCTKATVIASVAGHHVSLKIGIVNKVAIADTQLNMGTIDLEAIGITALPYQFQSYVGAADTNNVWSLWQLTTAGVLSSVDCDGNAASVPAGTETSWIFIDLTVDDIATMLDDFCNKFYWMRVSQSETPVIELVDETVEE